MANVAEILLRALFEDKGASRGVRGLSQDVQGLGTSSTQAGGAIGGLGGNVAALGGRLAAAAGGFMLAKNALDLMVGSTKKAVDAIETANLFEVGMGRFAGQATALAREVSSALRLSETEVKRQLGTWQVMLESMGLTGEKAFDLSASLTLLAQDMASFYNLPVDEAFTKLSAGIAGEVEPLKRLGILVNEATVKEYAYAKGIAARGAELTTSEKVMARYGVIMEATTKAQGDLNRTLESPANLLRAIGVAFADVQTQFGLFPAQSETFRVSLHAVLDPLRWLADALRDVRAGLQDLGAIDIPDSSDPTKVIAGLNKQLEDAQAKLAKVKAEYVGLPRSARDGRPEQWTKQERPWWDPSGPVDIPGYDKDRSARITANLEGDTKRAAELRAEMDRLQKAVEQLSTAKTKATEKAKAHADALAAEKKRLDEQERAARESGAKDRASAEAKALKALEDQIKATNAAELQLAISVVGLSQATGISITEWSNLLAVMDAVDPAMANVLRSMSALAEEGLAPIGDLLSQAVKGITDIEPLASGIVTYTKKWVDSSAFDQVTDSLRENVAWALGDAITTALTGGDVEEAAAGFARILTSTTSSALSSALSVIMKGGSLAEAGAAAGVWDPEANEGKGGVSWTGVGQMVGGLISYKGQQSGNRGQAALGGAISGASAGSSAGIGWGTLVGAVVGAAMGYMSAGKSTTPYHLEWGYRRPVGTGPYSGYWTGSSADVSGMGDMEERGIARKMTDTYRSNVLGFRDLLYTMRQPVTGTDLSGLGFDLSGKTGDFNALLTEVLTSTIPRQVLAKYTPAITTGLGGMGVSEGRVATEMAKFSPLEGDIGPAMEVFKEWVTTILQLQDAEEAMLTSLPAILEDLDKSQIDTWREGFADTLDQVGRLSAELGQLTTEEQIARAQEGAEAIATEVERSTQLIANLQAMREDFEASVVALQEGQRFNAAQRGGTDDLQGYLRSRFDQALRDINEGMLDPEQLQVAQEDALKYGQALLDLADQMEASVSLYRDLAESMADLDGQLSATLEDRLAALAADSQTSFSTAAGTALEKLASLREGLDGLTSQEKLTRLIQIRDLTTNTLQLTEDNLASLYRAGLSVTRIFDDLSESFDLAEAEKAGPQAKGEYVVSKLFKLQSQLGTAKSPDEVQAVLESIASYAQQLYAMDETINLKDPTSGKVMDVLTWLRPWLDQQEAQAAAKVEAWKAQNQAVLDSLREGLAGLATVAGDEATKLEASIAALRALVDEGLAGAVRDSGTQIEAWQTEIAAGMGVLKDAMGGFTDALTGPDVGLITALNTVKKEGDDLADTFDRLKDKIEKLIAVIDKGIEDDIPNPANGMGAGDLGSDPLSSARAWAARSSGAYDARMA